MAYEKEMDCRSNMSLSEMVLQYCFWRRGIHKVLSIKPGVWVYDVLMLGEIGFVLLNTRWMYPGRTNHLFCGVRVPSSVPCQLCRLSDQSSLRGAGSPCNFILPTINANMLPRRLRTKCFNRETVREISKNVIFAPCGRKNWTCTKILSCLPSASTFIEFMTWKLFTTCLRIARKKKAVFWPKI